MSAILFGRIRGSIRDLGSQPLSRLPRIASSMLVAALFALTCIGWSKPVDAQVYKWTDKEGHVHYGDHPPDDSAAHPVETPQGGVVVAANEVEVEDTEYRYFGVNGLSIEELNLAREAYGPEAISIRNGKPFRSWATCGWEVSWHYDTTTNGAGQCRIGKFKLNLHVHIFPKWLDRNSADLELQRKWDTFSRVVMTHELGHRQNDIRAANEMAFEMHRIAPATDCGELNSRVRELSVRIRTKYKLLNNAWDQAQVNGSEEDYYLH
jgi:predicted secreted Zn-dependent protease